MSNVTQVIPSALVDGMADGIEEGRACGEQPAGYWDLVLSFKRPELDGADRVHFVQGFLVGIQHGVKMR